MFKLALKVLARRKFFTFISLFGISLTLVVLVVAAAILDNLFAPRQPESRFDRVLCVYRFGLYGPEATMNTDPGYGFLDRFMRTLPDIERASIFSNPVTAATFHAGERIEMTLRRTDGEYWRILDFRFLEGRPFTPEEEASSAHVAVISDRLRRKLFGNAPAVGKTITFDDRGFRVIGVVPSVSIVRLAGWADIWVPISTMKSSDYRREMSGNFHGIVLARDRGDFRRLKDEFASRMKHVPIENPKDFTEARSDLDTPFEAFARSVTSSDRGASILRLLFFGAAILFMTLPALNLVTLNLSRILERASEVGVRKAFGAPRHKLVAQFVAENIVLTVIGGAIGFVLAVIVIALLKGSSLVPDADLDLNVRIFAYGMLIAVFFGIFSGVYPAWRMSRLAPVDSLRGGSL